MKTLICCFFLLFTLSNAFRLTKLDPTHVTGVINHHHHHVDHDHHSKLVSHGADLSKITIPTESYSVPDYTKSSTLETNLAIEDNNLHELAKVNHDHNHLQPLDQLQVHPINPHKCRHHLRLIAYYPRLIHRDTPLLRDFLRGQGDHELQMLDQFTGPQFIISRHLPHQHRDDDQTHEEKTAVGEDQHEEIKRKDKEHEHEIREKDILLKVRKFLPYF